MIRQATSILAEEASFATLAVRHWLAVGGRAGKQRIVVNGSPKTGTTWMVRLLTSLPGYRPVGHFRGDPDRWARIAPGDVVHDHAVFSDELVLSARDLNIKIILMIRDPRDQAVSRMFHIRRDETHAWNRAFNAMEDEEALMACIEGRPGERGLHMLPSAVSMTRLTYSWLYGGPELVYLVRYEDLLNDPAHAFGRVLGWLGIEADAKFVAAVVHRNRFERLAIGKRIWKQARQPGQSDVSSHFRKGVAKDWENHFTHRHIDRIEELIGDAISEWGYGAESSIEGQALTDQELKRRSQPPLSGV